MSTEDIQAHTVDGIIRLKIVARKLTTPSDEINAEIDILRTLLRQLMR